MITVMGSQVRLTARLTAAATVLLALSVSVIRPSELKGSRQTTTLKLRCSSRSTLYDLDLFNAIWSDWRINFRVSCQIPPELNSIIFRAWEVNQPVTFKVNISRNLWHQKQVTILRFHDSVELTKLSDIIHEQTLVLKATITNALRTISDGGVRDLSLRYALLDSSKNILYYGRIHTMNHVMKIRRKRETSSTSTSGYLIFANRLYLHRLSLDGNRTSVIVGGQEYATIVDVHVRNHSLFWIDSRRKIVLKSSLDGLKRGVVLDQGLSQPGGISIDWINNKLYWSDVHEEHIGVVDLSISCTYKYTLLSTDLGFGPRGLVVDPTTRFIYWTEWNRNFARIQRASMDGTMKMILHQQNIQRPYAIAIDYDDQVLYWSDFNLQRVERSNINGSDRQVVVNTGIQQPFAMTILGNKLYISDWELGILATDKSGGQMVEIIYNSFCDGTEAIGIQSIAEERQLLATNYCEEDRGCSHLCLLSANSDGYSCVCPDGMILDMDGFTCSLHSSSVNTTVVSNEGSCRSVGYTGCCISTNGTCLGTPQNCFCDSDCYHFGDCCFDIEGTCSFTQTEGNAFILLANILYIHRISTDGARNRTIYSDASASRIIAIDYNYRSNQIYWSTSNENGLWRSELNGSGVISLLHDNMQTIDDIAVDWISNKLYWTNNGPFVGIGILDLSAGYHRYLINTGQDNSPKAIVVDPLNRWLYWCEWGSIAKIKKASMDGRNISIVHRTNLTEPIGLTLDYNRQVLFWIDAVRDRIESSNVDGTNRRVITNQRIFQPFDISLHSDTLYFTDIITGLRKVDRSEGTITDIIDRADLCEKVAGIEVVSAERQPAGNNPCEINNGGCSHLCLLSSVTESGYSCVCPDGFYHDTNNPQTCLSYSTPLPTAHTLEHGTCAAAGYTGGCCTSGTCRGSPPTCSCDFTCIVFQDCCEDVPPSCQPDIDVLEFTHIPINVTVTLGVPTQPRSEFRCSVRSSGVTDFEWTFTSLSLTPSVPPTLQQIADDIGSLDAKYSVTSSDFTSVLTIDNVQFSDAGNYTCIASIGNRIDPIMATFVHIVEVPLSFPEVIGDHLITDRQAMHLRCRIRVFPQPSLTWIVKTNMTTNILLSNMSRVSISNLSFFTENGYPFYESQLIISNVTSEDSGDYTCVAVGDRHTLTKYSHTVNVTSTSRCQGSSMCLNGGTCVDHAKGYLCSCPDSFTGRNCNKRINRLIKRRPSFTESLSKMIKTDFGKPINLTCLAEGHPPPTYEWYKDNILIPEELDPYLYIPEALPDKRGNYSCKVINSKGPIESDPIEVIIPGIIQYVAFMEHSQSETFNISYEEVIANPLHLDRQGLIYSVEYLTAQSNTSEDKVLVTLLMGQVPLNYEIIKSLLALELERIGSVRSLIRFDGCELDNIIELNIGEIFKMPCPCQEYLHNLLDGRNALRVCGGSYTTGAQLQSIDFSQCSTVTNFISNGLCQAAQTIGDSKVSLEQLQIVVNITTSHRLQTSIDVTLLSVIIDTLTTQAIMIPIVS